MITTLNNIIGTNGYGTPDYEGYNDAFYADLGAQFVVAHTWIWFGGKSMKDLAIGAGVNAMPSLTLQPYSIYWTPAANLEEASFEIGWQGGDLVQFV